MKIRNGFVSNSSSSSFCILGVNVTEVDGDFYPSTKDTCLTVLGGISDYSGETFMGAYPESQDDNETLLQFKQRVLTEINMIIEREFPDTAEGKKFTIEQLDWYTDGGYDG